MVQNIRYVLRGLSRNPGFTWVAVVTLALGIGANTAIFSVVHAVLLQPLPYPEPDRLVRVYQQPVGQPETVLDVKYLDLTDWQRETQQFADLAAFASSSGGFLVEIDEVVETIEGKLVTWNLLPLLGVTPLHGRLFTAEDDQVGAEQVVVISEGLWRQRFGAEPTAVGQVIRVAGEAHRVVGVLPAGVEYPVGAQMWLPVVPSVAPPFSEERSIGFLNVVGRLAPEASIDQAGEELLAVIDRVTNPHQPDSAASVATLQPFAETLLGESRQPLWILLAAAGLVLLIACANVANLQISRGIGRRREIAVRGALGADWKDLVWLALLESTILALAGAVVGLVLAKWGLRVAMAWSPMVLFRGETIGLHGPVLGFCLALASLTAIGFGLLPLTQGLRRRLGQALHEAGGRSTAGVSSRRWLEVFATSQVALSLVVLIGAGLLLRNLTHLQSLEVGFDREQTLTVAVALLDEKYGQPSAAHQLFEELIEQVSTLPSVTGAAGALRRPLESPLGFDYAFTLEGRPEAEQPNYPRLNYIAVTPGYFETLGVPLRDGRVFEPSDREGAPPVAIVSARTARRFWGESSPVGQRLHWGPPESGAPWIEIVGVAGEVRYREIESVSLDVYVPYRQNNWPLRNLIVRADGDLLALGPAIRAQLRELDPAIRASEIATTRELVWKSMARPRFHTLLLSLFGGLALLIGAVGIYGVMAHSVVTRRREIGVRLTLGATAADIVRGALGWGMRWTIVGVVLGLVFAAAVSRVLASVLFEISTTDPATYIVTVGVLMGVALLACGVPALRASRVDPRVVLRSD